MQCMRNPCTGHTLTRCTQVHYIYNVSQPALPTSAGVALNSSPQGLAAYIIEKFSSGTDIENVHKKDGGLLDPDFPISLDSILDNICVYW